MVILAVSVAAAVFQIGLGGGQSRDGDAVGGAGNVVEADVVAEGDTSGFAAMLAADAEFDVRAHGFGFGDTNFHQFADAGLVNGLERVAGQDLLGDIGLQELVGVVAREAERHLGQVVGAEGEELGFFGDQV